jgi:hypothetical protein
MTTVGKSYDGLTTRVLEPLTPDRVLSDALDSVLTDDKDRDGKRILAFSPDARLRSELQIRQHKLRAGLLVGRPADIALTVAQMLLGFGSARASQEDAEAVVTQYVAVLAHLPLWAVQTACRRFASGSVTKTECPDWQRAYAPSTAQLCQLAESSVRKYWREEQRINDVLNGTPAYRPTEEERARVSKGFVELTAKITPKRRQRSRQLQPIGVSVSPALEQALREREELERIGRDGFETRGRESHVGRADRTGKLDDAALRRDQGQQTVS